MHVAGHEDGAFEEAAAQEAPTDLLPDGKKLNRVCPTRGPSLHAEAKSQGMSCFDSSQRGGARFPGFSPAQ